MILSLLLGIPLIGSAVVALLPSGAAARRAALGISLVPLLLSFFVLAGFDGANGGFQYIEEAPLLPRFGVSYALALDGLSLWLVMLTCLLFPLVCLGSRRAIREREGGYYAALLLLEGAILGTFTATDLFLFYLFWELMLVPMFFLIGIWGGEGRIYATVKFVLFTLAGSLLMLVALLVVGSHAGGFGYERLLENRLPPDLQLWCFLGFALAFLIKVPAVPFHTWLPDAHTEAPAGGSVILAGLLLKAGAYGLLRFALPLFPEASREMAPLLLFLGVVGIVHGGLAAAVQPDMKRLVAYSSVSHMGFILLGIFSFDLSGVQGSVLQMVNHGITTGALFFLVGMIYDRRHTRRLEDFGGLAKPAPLFAAAFLVTALASAGLPGLNGFVGEFLLLAAAWRTESWLAAVGVTGVVLGAWYLFRLFNGIFLGPLNRPENRSFADLGLREALVLAPLLLLMVWMGVRPNTFLRPMEKSVQFHVLEALKPPPPITDFAVRQRHLQDLEKERGQE